MKLAILVLLISCNTKEQKSENYRKPAITEICIEKDNKLICEEQ